MRRDEYAEFFVWLPADVEPTGQRLEEEINNKHGEWQRLKTRDEYLGHWLHLANEEKIREEE
jgi:hypothetical protein